MSDEVIMFEGVPIEELPRDKLLEALETMMHLQSQQMGDMTTMIRLRRQMDRMGR